MIAPSRNFQLHHPWLTVLFLVTQMVLVIVLALLPVWGWIHLRFSPVQRFYLPVYLESSVGVLAGSAPEYVKWIEKRAPGREWEIAQPEDLIPLKGGVAPFQLSTVAQSQGWSELGYTTSGTFKEQDTRDYLEANVFGGHSLLFLILQPLELVLVGWLCWKFFDNWRKDLARERGSAWDPNYRPTHWDEDLALFTKLLYGEAKAGAVQVRIWLTPKQKSMDQPAVVAVASATVSPSRNAQPAPPTTSTPKPKAVTPVTAKVVESASVRSPKPATPVTKPSQPTAPKPQPVKVQPDPKPEPASPFGKPAAEGQTERKWDISQWID